MFYQQTAPQVLEALGSSEDGLSTVKAREILERVGPNEIPGKKRSLFLLFLNQFNSVLVYILFAALAFSIALPFFEGHGDLAVTDFVDAIAIGVIILLNAILGFTQEQKAENSIAMLKQMSEPTSHVFRDGKAQEVPSSEIVPGDILLLEEGDKVSADGRLIMQRNCAVDESSLTGESESARKMIDAINGDMTIADQENMVFRGTVLTRGTAHVCVTGTGAQTELGKIARLVSDVSHPPTPLEVSMAAFGRWIGMVILALCGVIFVVGIWRGSSVPEMILASASLAVSAVPEGLPAIVTVCLALGVQRMAKKKALTRELRAIETLGSVTVICSDKTGTITENRMKVQEVVLGSDDKPVPVQWSQDDAQVSFEGRQVEEFDLLMTVAMSCNNAHSLEIGDPTEIGLLKVATIAGMDRLPILEEDQPFTSEEKYMMTSHSSEEGSVKYLKGAPEKILALSTHILEGGSEEKLSEDARKKMNACNEEMASRALRVLGMAYRQGDKTVFVGLIGMMDPPREGVKDAIETASNAGIRTVMITGDHSLTARAIAAKVGIESEVTRGRELAGMSDEELQKHVQIVSIYARVSPEDKVRILRALQDSGEIVAMGGDGVNDAPALKRAHVGFAMGKRGTDVARETAAMVLTDDHFASVVHAIEEGRTIYDNINKFVVYLLRANFYELAVVLIAILAGFPLPYLPIHILLINLITDSLPALALATEVSEPDVMTRPPRNPKEHILKGEMAFIILAAIIATFASFHIYLRELNTTGDLETARALAVFTAICFELSLVFTSRSKRSLFQVGFFTNRYLLVAVAIAFSVFLLGMYTPINQFIHLIPLTLDQCLLPLAWGIGSMFFFEILKIFWKPENQW